MDEHAILEFIDSLDYEKILTKKKQCLQIPDSECIDKYDAFFYKLNELLK